MRHPLPRRTQNPENIPGVYIAVDDLVRLQFQATGFSFLPRQPIHSLLSGRYASRLRGRGMSFEEIRRYLPGDDIRNMDWKVTARLRKPHVRSYSEERDRPALFLVDQRVNMFFGSARTMKSVTAAEAAALGLWRALDAGDRVGAMVFSDTEIAETRPHRSRRTALKIIGDISRLNQSLHIEQPPSGSDQLNETLRRANRVATHDFLVCVVSDFYGADEETKRLITRLSEHNDVLAAAIYDPLGRELPDAGRMIMSDGAQQAQINTSDRSLRSEFTGRFDSLQERIRNFLLKRQIPVLPIHTAEPVAAQLRRLIGQQLRPGTRR